MWKYNKYNIGAIIGHNDSPELEFQIRNILTPVEEVKGNYMYYCKLIDGGKEQLDDIFNYLGSDLFFLGMEPKMG